VVVITIIGVLLAGVVFMNVAVLRLNIRLDQLGRDRAQLHGDIAQLSSQLSSEQASARIQAQARSELHLVPASAADTTFVDLPPR
jgi:cell division protein FtsL